MARKIVCPRCDGPSVRVVARYVIDAGNMLAEYQCRECWHSFERSYTRRAPRSVPLAPLAPVCTANYAAPAEGANETNDCAVRALAVAACIAYADAHAIMARNGRRPRRGTPTDIITKACRDAAPGAESLTWSELYVPRVDSRYYSRGFRTVAAFARAYPVGHFVAWSRTHAFAIVDGVLHDWRATRGKTMQRVTGAVRLA
jgi:hypothetical protein